MTNSAGDAMPICKRCSEPAAKTATVMTGGRRESVDLCYRHFAETGLTEIPVERFAAAAQASRRPVNGVFFVREAVLRFGAVASARDVCHGVVEAARKRFKGKAAEVVAHWGLSAGHDVGSVYGALVHEGLLPAIESISVEDFALPFSLSDLLASSDRETTSNATRRIRQTR